MKIFLFYFEMAIKITGSAQNFRVGRVSGNTPIFLGLKQLPNSLMSILNNLRAPYSKWNEYGIVLKALLSI